MINSIKSVIPAAKFRRVCLVGAGGGPVLFFIVLPPCSYDIQSSGDPTGILKVSFVLKTKDHVHHTRFPNEQKIFLYLECIKLASNHHRMAPIAKNKIKIMDTTQKVLFKPSFAFCFNILPPSYGSTETLCKRLLCKGNRLNWS